MRLIIGPRSNLIEVSRAPPNAEFISVARKYFLCGNWKMNGSKTEVESMFALLKDQFNGSAHVQLIIAFPSVYLSRACEELPSGVIAAAQNCYKEANNGGAFTGEISAGMISDVGGRFVIVGHSERREIFNESDLDVVQKIRSAHAAGLGVIACIGETKTDRLAGDAFTKCASQLNAVCAGVADWNKVVVAYEPVWAIGTGESATPDQVQQVHRFLRSLISIKAGKKVADSARIIYGGSINSANCADLIKESDIDGFLVGGASLKPEFLDIYNTVADSALKTHLK